MSNPAFEGYAQAGNVLVKVTAAEGVLPEGATVQATRIERQDVVDAVAERVESQGKVLEDAIAIDVTLLDKDGNEIQPNGALNVCFFDANVEGEEVGVYRVSDDASQVETIGARQADPAVQSFDVDHFTIYVATGSNYASTGIKLDSSSIEVGETIKALGERKWNSKGYSWTSSDASVAKVAFSKENRADIVGVSPGVATITYSYKVGNRTYTDTAKVHVVPSVVKHTVSWYVNGDVSKSTKVRDGEVPSYGGTPNRAGDWQYKQFVGWATAPNSKNYLTEGELPAVTEDVSYYAVFTSQAYFYFVLEGRSNTSTVAKDYMYAGEGTMIVPDGFNSGDRWYDGSNFSIADYIVSTPSDEAIRNGIRAAYADYSPDWTYTIDWTTLSVAGSSVDYRYNTFDYGKSMHTDGALSINKDTTIGVTYLTQKPDGSVVTNSTSHDKNVAFGLNSTVNTDAPSFETDGYTYNSRVNHNGASYVFDGWYLDQSYTTKAPDSVSPSSSASFYARYIANTKTLTYQANGGAFSDGTIQDKTAVQQVGARVSFISNPSRDGYVFTGWKDKDTGDVYSAGVSGMIMPDRDVTLVAQWQGVIPIKLLGDETKKTYSGTKQSYTGFTVSGLDMGSYTVSGVQALAQGTDVGTYKGTIDYSGMRIFEKSSGSDVTNQFEVVEASEPTLIVEKAPISIVTPDDSKLYDGAPLIATKGAELSGLVNDETATLIVIGSRTDVGTSDNAYQIDWSGSAKESNYFIDEETIGTLEIAKRPVTVTAKGGEKQYDGKPLTAADTGYDIGGEGLVEGHEADVALSTVESVAVKDGDVDVANNYDVATADGSLKVTNRDAKYEVTLKANSSTGNVYDGTEKSAKGVVTDRFVIDDVEYAVSGYETQDPAEVAAGVYTNNVSGDFKVKDPAGNDVTSEFAVHTEDGELEILPREVTLASGSATKIYDGTALELPDVTVGGDGFVGTEASVRATGSITDIGGPIDNTIVVEPGEGFIAANYNVVYTVGKLTVTSASIDPDDPSYTGIQINNPYDVQYNGQEQRWIPSVFDRNNHKLVTGTDYTVSYSQDVRNVGVVTVTITGIGNYMGTVERAYNITPAPAVIRVNDSSKAYGEADPGFTGAVEGLFGDDLLGDIAYSRTNIDEEVGNYSDVLTATVGNLNGNYTYTVEPGNFSIVPAGGNVVTIDATGLTKTYDGQPVSVVAEASVDGSALLYSVDGSTWSDANPEFTNAGTYTVYVKATHDGYEESAPVSATVVINPAPVTIAVADASKVAGADDPAFSGTVEGLVAEGDLGDINYVRPGGEEAAGVYVGALTALYTQNGNYRVAVLNGTFTITAAPVTPPTPPTPPTSPTPTPLPTPGTVPPDSPIAPVVTPIVDALQGAAEAVIGDNDTPLASHDHASCWVHWYIILGIIVTALYGACVALRRGLFSRKLKKYEDGLTGGGDPAPGAPSIGDDASAPIAPKGAPAGATLAAGLGE